MTAVGVPLACILFALVAPLLYHSARENEPPWQGFEDLSLPSDCPMDIKSAVVSDATSSTSKALDGKVRSLGCPGGRCARDVAEGRLWVVGS